MGGLPISAEELLHHIPDVQAAMREIIHAVEIRLLRKLGALLLRLPGAVELFAGLGLPRGKLHERGGMAEP